jgi:ABC-type polysaccharide/polyol phosphate export permease
MFLSPIGFRPDMVPAYLGFLVYLNPIHYLIAVYRSILMTGQTASIGEIGIFSAICLFSFIAGSSFFRRFKSILVDYE